MFDSIIQLTSAAAAGESAAVEHLFRTRFDIMYAEARRVSGRDESFCLDVVQEAFVRILHSMKPLDSEPRLRAWLLVVVQSCAYDRLRQETRRHHREQAVCRDDRSAQEESGTKERLDWLRKELLNHQGKDAALLLMRYRLGWTLQRIAEVVGLKPGAVDGRIRRSTQILSRRARETFK